MFLLLLIQNKKVELKISGLNWCINCSHSCRYETFLSKLIITLVYYVLVIPVVVGLIAAGTIYQWGWQQCCYWQASWSPVDTRRPA